jgi:hypothetical protein
MSPPPGYHETGLTNVRDIARLSPDNAYTSSAPNEFDRNVCDNVEVVFMIDQSRAHKPHRAIKLAPEVTMTGDEFSSAHSWNERPQSAADENVRRARNLTKGRHFPGACAGTCKRYKNTTFRSSS